MAAQRDVRCWRWCGIGGPQRFVVAGPITLQKWVVVRAIDHAIGANPERRQGIRVGEAASR